MKIKHIILIPEGFPPMDTISAFPRLISDCNLWWALYGIYFEDSTVEVRTHTTVGLVYDNPWYETLVWWKAQPDYDPKVLVVVYLSGWNSYSYIGWGGPPLAVVGEYALSRITSRPLTPDDPTDAHDGHTITDDWDAGKLILHEIGHCLGLTHDFVTPGAVMGYGNEGFNSHLGEQGNRELRAVNSPVIHQACLRRPE